MSEYLAAEVRDLGYEPSRIFKTAVELRGSLNDCIHLNLNLRCATQVRFSIHSFRAQRPEDVYQEVLTIPWEEIIPIDEKFSVSNSAEHVTLNNTMYMNVRVKDAIVDRFREKAGRRPDSGKNVEGVAIHLYWKEDHAEIYLDTSGQVISRHGYRRIPGKAPIQESLAAALIRATRWDGKSHFINPMCGSGTLAIEAALYVSGRKPGLIKRDYSFCHLLGFDPAFLERISADLKKNVTIPEKNFRIIASDIRSGAVEDARENATFAGVEDLIEFHCCDYKDTPVPEPPGVILLNPEYGERMGEMEQLKQVYKEIGDFFKKKCSGYFGYVFTGNLELGKSLGLKPKRRMEFYSAQLDCRFFEFELYLGSRRDSGTHPAEEPTSK